MEKLQSLAKGGVATVRAGALNRDRDREAGHTLHRHQRNHIHIKREPDTDTDDDHEYKQISVKNEPHEFICDTPIKPEPPDEDADRETMFDNYIEIAAKIKEEPELSIHDYWVKEEAAAIPASIKCTPAPAVPIDPDKFDHTYASRDEEGSKEKPYMCNQCDFSCAFPGSLKRHKVIHSKEKPFKCSECDYQCKRLDYLKTHRLTHARVKPYRCDLCDYSSTTAGHLKVHKYKHFDIKPFKCGKCSYSSAVSGNLRSHERVHSDRKPFVCDRCDCEFKRIQDFRKHFSIHFVEDSWKTERMEFPERFARTFLDGSGDDPFEPDPSDRLREPEEPGSRKLTVRTITSRCSRTPVSIFD